MAEAIERRPVRTIHPVHSILLASTIPLFLGALLSDWAYSSNYHVQWTNFAAWLVAGGLLFSGLALLFAVVELFRADGARRGDALLYLFLILATFIVGIFNVLIHAKDAWAAMPGGLILSVIALLLAIAANWAAHAHRSKGAVS